jgi:hypothetical protein
MQDLRDVRSYHWKEALYMRKAAASLRSRRLPSVADAMDRIADTHIKCVQILNDYVSGTAEEDSRILKTI